MTNPEETKSGVQYLETLVSRRRLLRMTVLGTAGMVVASSLAACAEDDPDEEPAAAADDDEADVVDDDPDEVDEEPDDDVAEVDDTDDVAVDVDDESTVVISSTSDFETMDPHEDTNMPSLYVNMFDPVIDLDEEMELTPAVAESWENIDDLTWELQLREDVVFHDGTELTAEDVAFSYNWVLDPEVESRSRTWIAMIDRAEVVDDYTVHVITNEPFPALPASLRRVFMLPAETFQEMGPEEFAVNPVGTAPYKFVEWVRDDHLLLERFDESWRGAPEIDYMLFRPIPEASTRTAAVLAGEVDLARHINSEDVPSLEENPETDVRSAPSVRVYFTGINCWNEPLSDYRVRQALNYAVDKEAIIEHILNGQGYQVASVTGDMIFGHNPNLEPYPYDPDRARELLAEAGVPDGFQTTYNVAAGQWQQGDEMAEAVAGYLAEVGVECEMVVAPFEDYWERWLAGEHDGLYFLTVGIPTFDADYVMGAHLHSERRGIYYHSPETDAMIEEAAQEFDVDAREALYHELEAKLQEEAPWIFMHAEAQLFAVNSSLEWEAREDESVKAYEMRFS